MNEEMRNGAPVCRSAILHNWRDGVAGPKKAKEKVNKRD